jgi:hypothetical protein
MSEFYLRRCEHNERIRDVEHAAYNALHATLARPILRAMTKRKQPRRKLTAVTDAEIDQVLAEAFTPPDRAATASLHDLFAQQTREILENSDLDEEQKQSILVAMQCPCCSGGTGAFTFKLKPRR